MKLTKTDKETFKFIFKTMKKEIVSCTLRELADNFNITLKAAQDRVNRLAKKGIISTEKNKARSIRILENTTKGLVNYKIL